MRTYQRVLSASILSLCSSWSACSEEHGGHKEAAAEGTPAPQTASEANAEAAVEAPVTTTSLTGSGTPQCVPTVAAMPLQRLTQSQYQASVRSILQLKTLPALDLPADEQQGPFAANATQQVSDLALVQYQAAAEAVVTAATASLDSLLPCAAAALDSPCLATAITQLGQRFFRRPLTADEQTDYQTLAAPYLQAGSGANAVQAVLEAFLQAPDFLYRPEFGGPSVRGSVPLSGYELAARLSFALVGTTPDDALLQAAADGSLTTTAGLTTQAQRLLASPAFGPAAGSFVSQWLGLNAIASTVKDPTLYPSFNPALLTAMEQELQDFSTYVLQKADGRLETLLTAPYSVLTEPLFSLYGVSKPSGYTAGTAVPFDPTQRAGVLSQAAFLATQSHPNQTSIVLRGKIIRENLLCQPMPTPPATSGALPQTVPANATTRQIFALHESNPACAGCHLLMDPIGLTLENFDAIGAWRTAQGTSVIDPSGLISGTQASNGPVANFTALAKTLAASPDVQQCFVKQAFRYTMARTELSTDTCALTNLRLAFDAANHDIRQLFLAAVLADPFRLLSSSP